MKSLDALNKLSDLMASQRGLVTTAQAKSMGVDRQTLSRLEGNGHVERIISGVYRSCSAPSFREERVYAAWLALDSAKPAWMRPRNKDDLVVSHSTAAWLMDLGELNPEPLTFTAAVRKQSRRSGIRIVKATLQDQDVISVNGIPTTSPQRTVLDLLRDGEDESLVANVLKGVISSGPNSLSQSFKKSVDGLANARGHPAGYQLFEALIAEGTRA